MSDTGDTPKKEPKPFYEWSPLFLRRLAACGNVSKAANEAKITRNTAYRHRKSNSRFKQSWDNALEQAADIMEAEAWRRAVKGVKEPVGWYKGKPGGAVRHYSDTLLIFLLKAHRPERFRENVNVQQSGDIKIRVEYGDGRGGTGSKPAATTSKAD